VWGHFRRCRVCVATCSSGSVYCRDVGVEVVLVSGLVRRCRFVSLRFRRRQVCVGTCSSMPAYCREVLGEVGFCREEFGDLGLVSRRLPRFRFSVGKFSARPV